MQIDSFGEIGLGLRNLYFKLVSVVSRLRLLPSGCIADFPQRLGITIDTHISSIFSLSRRSRSRKASENKEEDKSATSTPSYDVRRRGREYE